MLVNDSFFRKIDYLRISVTDRCNLRCLYCMPEEGIRSFDHNDILRYEEIEETVLAAAETGISRIRLTGGEPLVRPGITDLVGMISSVPGIKSLAMTTNGTLLGRVAEKLASSGLQRVNISLDTLSDEKFQTLTRLGRIESVFEGIDAAVAADLAPVKINTVVIRDYNDDELESMTEWALSRGLQIRFIEYMPVGGSALGFSGGFYSSDLIRTRLLKAFPGMVPAESSGAGPAGYWKVPGSDGLIGIIESVSQPFCISCNRIRLTADGKIKPCLFSGEEIGLISVLRDRTLDPGQKRTALKKLLIEAAEKKPGSHGNFCDAARIGRTMHEIGG